jgi:hypothetical protein
MRLYSGALHKVGKQMAAGDEDTLICWTGREAPYRDQQTELNKAERIMEATALNLATGVASTTRFLFY